jgi:outer membrane receptor protein involved in Fe transport
MKSKLYLLLALFISLSSYAQEYEISGKVIDLSQDFPLEYATITILDNESGKTINGGVTNRKGKFKLKVPEGIYNIKVEYISFKTRRFKDIKISDDKDLGTIGLKFEASNLDEVVVEAKTTELDVRLDKKIYTIGEDLTTSGATVSDALANVPSITVDIDGAISLRGNENVRILINGKPSAIAGFGSTDVFRQLPSDAIEKVEVITSPSARYDAAGTAGIINIVLKREKTLGFNGTLRVNTGTPLNNGVSLNANARTDKFNFFTTLGYSHRKPPGNALFENFFTSDSASFDRIIEDRDYNRNRKNFNVNAGATYFFNDSTEITASYFGRTGEDVDKTFNATKRFIENDLDSETLRIENEIEDEESHQGAINFERRYDDKGHKLTADAQYSVDYETTTTLIDENRTQPNDSLIAKDDIVEDNDEREILIQADYVRPMGEAQFEAGFRGNYENEITDFRLKTLNEDGELALDNDISNIFDYDENVTAAYVQYGNKLGKFSFLAGLRFEHTQLKGTTTPIGENSNLQDILGDDIDLNFDNNFANFFPTLNLTYEFREDENMTLGYNRRINRPRGWYVNPFPSRSSRTTIFQGNPSLQPAFADAFDLGYLRKWEEITLNSSIYYQRETESFERIQQDTGQTTSDGIPIIRRIPINLSTNERYGAELGLLSNPTEWLRINTSINYFKFISEGTFNGDEFGAENESFFARLSTKIDLPYKIQWQTNGFFRGPRENAQTKTKSILSLNLALSKDLFDDRATISLNVRDLFNSRFRERITNTLQFRSDSEFQWRQRQITLNFVYRFNQQKEEQRRNNNSYGNKGY